MKPRIIVLIGALWPGHESAGPNLSVKAMCETLSEHFDFLLVARDRAFGAAEPLAPSNCWRDLGWARIHYLPVGPLGARGLTALLRATPHDLVFANGFFDKEFTIPLLLARHFGKAPRTPVVLSPRGEFSSGALGLKSARKTVYRALARAAGLVRDIVFHVTSAEEQLDTRAKFPNNRVELITNIRPLFPLPPHKPSPLFRAAFLGRISPIKGLDVAIEALARVNVRVAFTIYGPISDPAYWSYCEKLIATLPPNVTARHGGELANDAVPAAMAAQDLMFLPSRSENFGHAIFEALAAGTPVLIGDKTPWRGLPALKAGFDLAVPDPDSLANTIDQFAALPLNQRQEWRVGARALAERFVETSEARYKLVLLFESLRQECMIQ